MGIFNDKTTDDHIGHNENPVTRGQAGPVGPPGRGFKLMDANDCNMDNNFFFLKTQDDHRVDDDYDEIVKDPKIVVNKAYLNS